MSETILIFLVVSLIIKNLADAYRDGIINARNIKMYQEEVDKYKEELINAAKIIHRQAEELRVMKESTTDDLIKALIEGFTDENA